MNHNPITQPWNVQRTNDGWVATNSATYAEIGPFDTLDEATEYITRYDNCQEWQDQVATELNKLGQPGEADEFRNASTDYAMTYRDAFENPQATAQRLLDEINKATRERERRPL